MKRLILTVSCLLALGCNQDSRPEPGSTPPTGGSMVPNRSAATGQPTGTKEPDDPANTGINVRDRDNEMKVPTDQSEKRADIQITADIRKGIEEKKLSIDAENVKIITQDGRVTLRGPVTTEDEKRAVEDIASSVAGAGNVNNELEIVTR